MLDILKCLQKDVLNQFLPIQPHPETIIFVKEQLDKLCMLP